MQEVELNQTSADKKPNAGNVSPATLANGNKQSNGYESPRIGRRFEAVLYCSLCCEKKMQYPQCSSIFLAFCDKALKLSPVFLYVCKYATTQLCNHQVIMLLLYRCKALNVAFHLSVCLLRTLLRGMF